MLRLVAVLALARAETTAPGTGYSDADSCPPPETTPFGAVTTHSCSFCASIGAREIRGACMPVSRDLGEERVERRGSLPDAGVGINKTRAGRAAAEEAPLARRLGEREGEEVLFVTYENLTL